MAARHRLPNCPRAAPGHYSVQRLVLRFYGGARSCSRLEYRPSGPLGSERSLGTAYAACAVFQHPRLPRISGHRVLPRVRIPCCRTDTGQPERTAKDQASSFNEKSVDHRELKWRAHAWVDAERPKLSHAGHLMSTAKAELPAQTGVGSSASLAACFRKSVPPILIRSPLLIRLGNQSIDVAKARSFSQAAQCIKLNFVLVQV
jgi:hypothetical protein